MDLAAYLKGLKRSSKGDAIPGTVEAYLDEPCPACGKSMRLMKPCCSSKFGKKECVCGYKINLTS
jgi:hypothetical protein